MTLNTGTAPVSCTGERAARTYKYVCALISFTKSKTLYVLKSVSSPTISQSFGLFSSNKPRCLKKSNRLAFVWPSSLTISFAIRVRSSSLNLPSSAVTVRNLRRGSFLSVYLLSSLTM